MKAIVCQQVGRLRLVEAGMPACKPGHALVRIRRIGVCGTDLHAFQGNQPFFTYPRVLGHELSGVIEQVGDNDAGLCQGQRVSIMPYLHCGACIACRNGKTNCCVEMNVLGVHVDGGMCEYVSVSVSHIIPAEELTLDQAAIAEPLSIGAHAVRRSNLRKGDTALVIGAGPIGLGVMALAKLRGARVIAMDINDERLAFCRKWAKADHTVNAMRKPEELLGAVTGGEYADVVFDATGNARSMADSFRWVAHGGTLVFVGLVKSDIAFHDPDFHKREITLMASRNATREDFDHVKTALRDGMIEVDDYITHRTSFLEVPVRFNDWLKPDTGVIKAMIEL